MTRNLFAHLPARPDLRRWLRRGLIAWAGWLVLGAIVLNQPLMEGWINRKPERVHVDWGFALSLMPGHVIAWGVVMRGHGRDVAWGMHAHRAQAWFVPWGLLGKEIRLAGLRGSGVAVNVRRSKAVLPPPAPRERPWTFRLSGQVGNIWSLSLFEQLHATGVGRAGVELRKVLSGGEMEIRGGWLDWTSLELAVAGKPWASEGRLQASVNVAPLLPSKSSAQEKFAALGLSVDLDAKVPTWRMDADGLRREPEASRSGELKLHLAIDKGRLSDSSEFSLRQPVRVVDQHGSSDRELSAALKLEDDLLSLAVDLPPGAKDGMSVSARLAAPWTGPGAPERPGEDQQGPGFAESLAGKASGRVELNVAFGSLVALRPWLSRWRGLEIDGRGRAHLDLKLERGKVSPDSTLRFDRAELSAALLGHRGRASIDSELERLPGTPARYRLRLSEVEIATAAGDTVLSDADAELDILGNDAGNLLAHPPALQFRMQDASVPDLRVFNQYLPGAAVAIGAGRARVSLDLMLDPDKEKA